MESKLHPAVLSLPNNNIASTPLKGSVLLLYTVSFGHTNIMQMSNYHTSCPQDNQIVNEKPQILVTSLLHR